MDSCYCGCGGGIGGYDTIEINNTIDNNKNDDQVMKRNSGNNLSVYVIDRVDNYEIEEEVNERA